MLRPCAPDANMNFYSFLFKNLRRRKMRSLLTTLGVSVAVGTTVALLGISHGFEQSTQDAFENRDVDIVVMAAGVLDQLNSDLEESVGPRILEVPGIRDIAPGLLELVEYSDEHESLSVLIQGWNPDAFQQDSLKLLSGTKLTADHRRKALVGKTLAQVLRKQVGDQIEVQREMFEIVGIYEAYNVFENGAVTVPLKELQELMFRQGSLTGYSVRLSESAPSAQVVCEQINQLTGERGQLLGLSALPTQEYVANSLHIKLAHAMAWMTSVIAIVVGSIGILNTMIMSVIERLREIAVLRAIGWRRSRVVRMVLGEAILLSLCGAVIGTTGAVLAIRGLTLLPVASGYIAGSIAPVVIGRGFLLALLVGLVGGAYPAYHASRLLPSEGLRHE